MSYDRVSDEELMVRVAAGNRDAMDPLVRRYASPLLTFIRRMIGNWHRGEELFQEVFLDVWRHRRRYEYPRPFRAWLFGIAVNKCRADFRQYSPAAALDIDEPQAGPTAGGSSPVEAAIASETATLVAQAVATLPPGQRAVLVLRVWNGQGYAEIAATLGLTESTTRSQMFHAVAAIRRHLEPRLRQRN